MVGAMITKCRTLKGMLVIALLCLAASCSRGDRPPSPTVAAPTAVQPAAATVAAMETIVPEPATAVPLGDVDRFVRAALAATTDEDVDGLDRVVEALAAEGRLDDAEAGLVAAIAEARAEGRAAPGLHLALASVYGRKGLASKAYAAVIVAEEAAKAPGVRFSLAAVHGRKALLSAVAGGCSLAVRSPVAGAFVSVDGGQTQPAPARFVALRPGRREVVVTCSGYAPWRETVEARDGVALELVAEPVPLPVSLTVESDPPGAAVSVDGRLLGETPWNGTVEPGDYRLDFSLSGLEAASEEVTLGIGSEPVSVFKDLVYGSASLALAGDPAGLPIKVNDMDVGSLPLVMHNLPSGEYRVSSDYYRTPDGSVYEARDLAVVVLAVGEDRELTIDVANAMSSVSAPSGGFPDGATVYVDGRKAGTVPFGPVDFAVGPHAVKVVAAGRTVFERTESFLSGPMRLMPPRQSPSSDPIALSRLSPKIDGKADDWDGVAPIPGSGSPSSWPKGNAGKVGAVYLAYDSDYLYGLIECPEGKVPGCGYQLQLYNSEDERGSKNGALLAVYNPRRDTTYHVKFDAWNSSVRDKTYTRGASCRTSERYIEMRVPRSAIGRDVVEMNLSVSVNDSISTNLNNFYIKML